MPNIPTGFPKVEITEADQAQPSWSRVKLIDHVLGNSNASFVPRELVCYVGVPPENNPDLDSDDEDEESSYDSDTYDANATKKTNTANAFAATTKIETSFITPTPAKKDVIDMSRNPFSKKLSEVSKKLSEVTHVLKLNASPVSPQRLFPSDSDSDSSDNKKKKSRPSGTTPDRPVNVPRSIDDKTAPFPALMGRLREYASPQLAMTLLFCFAELVFNMALPAAVLKMEGSVKTPLITKQWTLLDGFFSEFAYFYGVGKIGASTQGKENQQIRMLAHSDYGAYKRALHFMKLIRNIFPRIGTGSWEYEWKDQSYYVDLSMDHWWDNVVKTITRKGIVSVEWLYQQSVVLKQEINPKVVQGLYFPCAIMWKETMHHWNRTGKANYKLHLTEVQKDWWKNRVQQIGKGENPLARKKRPKKVPDSYDPPNYQL